MKKTKRLNVNILPAIEKFEMATRRIVTSNITGGFPSMFKGRGLEFSGYRDYTPNDDAERIDWKASTRTNELVIREYVEEKNLDILFLIDAGHNMVFGSTKKLKIEYALEVIASVSNVALEEENNVGAALFTEGVFFKIAPSRGKVQFQHLMSELTRAEYYGKGGSNLIEALRFAISYLNEGSTLVIVSDFIGLDKDWETYIKMAARKLDVISIVIRDPLDESLPPGVGQVVLQSPKYMEQLVINPDEIKMVYEKEVKKEVKILENKFVESNVDFAWLRTNQDFVKPIIGLFSKRVSQWM